MSDSEIRTFLPIGSPTRGTPSSFSLYFKPATCHLRYHCGSEILSLWAYLYPSSTISKKPKGLWEQSFFNTFTVKMQDDLHNFTLNAHCSNVILQCIESQKVNKCWTLKCANGKKNICWLEAFRNCRTCFVNPKSNFSLFPRGSHNFS